MSKQPKATETKPESLRRKPIDGVGEDGRWEGVFEIGDRIRKVRLLKGMQQDEFADNIDVARAMVGRWESNATVPKIANVLAISETFGVSLEWLVAGHNACCANNVNKLQALDAFLDNVPDHIRLTAA